LVFFKASNGSTMGVRTNSVAIDRRIPIFSSSDLKTIIQRTSDTTNGIRSVYIDFTYNVETAILQGYPRSLLKQSHFRKQRIVAIKNPTSKYSKSDIFRFLAPAIWNSWQCLQKNNSVVQFMKRGFKPRVLAFWESINRTNDPGGPPWVPEQF
jgi:hypothetical protein